MNDNVEWDKFERKWDFFMTMFCVAAVDFHESDNEDDDGRVG